MSILRVPWNITFPGAGSPGANVWHCRTDGLLGTTETSQLNTICGWIRSFYAALNAYFPTGTTLAVGTVVEEGTSREVVPTVSSVTGIGTGSAPQALAAVVTWRTTIAARRGRGRTFVGPLVTVAMQSDGTLNDSFLGALRTAAGALVTSSLAFGNGAIGVYGYSGAKDPNAPRNPADARIFRDVVGYQCRDLFGILRSRRD